MRNLSAHGRVTSSNVLHAVLTAPMETAHAPSGQRQKLSHAGTTTWPASAELPTPIGVGYSELGVRRITSVSAVTKES